MRRIRIRKPLVAIGIVATLALAALLIPSFRKAAEIRDLSRNAREAVKAGREVEARQLLDRWSALSPLDGEVDYDRAILEVRANRPAKALDAMRRAVSRGYPKEPLMVLRAVLLARAGKFDEAQPVLASSFQNGAEPRVEVAEALSRIYLKNFRLTETIQVLESWIKAAPEDPRPYLLRNEVAERMNAEPAVLIRNYREALRRDPGLIDGRLGLAEKLREASLFDEAEVEYSALLERDPKNIRGLNGAGRIALMKGDLPAASRYQNEALALDPRDKVALRELGVIALNEGRASQALARLTLAVEVDPFDPEVRFSYAMALKASGEASRAAEEFAAVDRLKKEQQRIIDLRQSLIQQPDDVDLRFQVARWLIERGHDNEGLEWCSLILKQKPGHPATCRLLADYHTQHGNPGLANYYRLEDASAAAGK